MTGAERPGSAVEIEVARRLLLEPEAVVIRRVGKELGGLLQHVLVRLLVFVGQRPLDVELCGRIRLGMLQLQRRRSGWRVRRHRRSGLEVLLRRRRRLEELRGARLVGVARRGNGVGRLVAEAQRLWARCRTRRPRWRQFDGRLGRLVVVLVVVVFVVVVERLVLAIVVGHWSVLLVIPVGLVLLDARRGGLCVEGRGRLLWTTADRPERLSLGALNLGWIGTAPPLEVEMVPDRVVKQTHLV